jgi:hypothetical protein
MNEEQIRKLRELRAAATLERAEFSILHPEPGDELPTSENDVTAFIKKRTKLYLETWVLPEIDEMISKARSLEKGQRVKARFPFADHVSLGTIVCDQMLGNSLGYIVELDDRIPRGWCPNDVVFVPAENMEVVS